MGKPKKRTSPRATGARRSHLVVKLARAVNAKSPVKAYTSRREAGKKLTASIGAGAATSAEKIAGLLKYKTQQITCRHQLYLILVHKVS